MGAGTGFFYQREPQVTRQNLKAKTLVYAGRDGDAEFCALAAAILDNMLSNPKANRALLTRIMPKTSGPGYSLLPVEERLKRLAGNQQSLTKLVGEMADSLRQIAVEEMSQDPENEQYHDALVKHSLAAMRQPGVPIGICALSALANRLNIPVTFREKSCESDLPLLHPHMGPASGANVADPVSLQKVSDYYLVSVHHSECFMSLSERRLPASQLPEVHDAGDSDNTLILHRKRKHNQQILKAYQVTRNRLTTMLSAGEIDQEQLLSAYIRSIKPGSLGTQSRFTSLMNDGARPVRASGAPEILDRHEQLNHELIGALARLASLGLVNENELYEQDVRQAVCP